MARQKSTNPYRIEGPVAFIELCENVAAVVDTAELPRLLEIRWFAGYRSNGVYAQVTALHGTTSAPARVTTMKPPLAHTMIELIGSVPNFPSPNVHGMTCPHRPYEYIDVTQAPFQLRWECLECGAPTPLPLATTAEPLDTQSAPLATTSQPKATSAQPLPTTTIAGLQYRWNPKVHDLEVQYLQGLRWWPSNLQVSRLSPAELRALADLKEQACG